jgi:hypothetical protein
MAYILDGIPDEDLRLLIESNPSLRGYLQGYLAEYYLTKIIQATPGVSSVEKIPDSDKQKGDFSVDYKGVNITIECKSLLSSSLRAASSPDVVGKVSLKSPGTRSITSPTGGSHLSTHLPKGTFDILAICTYNVTGIWSFYFVQNRFLPEAEDMPGMLSTKINIDLIETPGLTEDVSCILEQISLLKYGNTSSTNAR